MGISFFCCAQVVYVSPDKSDDVKCVFITENKAEATRIVYKSASIEEANSVKGVWYLTDWKAEASYSIYITAYKYEAEEVIYYTEDKNEISNFKKM